MEERFKTFTVLTTNVCRCIHKIKTEEMAEFELKSSHVTCLYYLYLHTSLTARELCDISEEDKANVSRSIKYLEENGYVECSVKHQKRYLSPFSLTEKGLDTASRIAAKIDRMQALASAGLSDEQRTVFYESLALINQNLQKICDEYPQKSQ